MTGVSSTIIDIGGPLRGNSSLDYSLCPQRSLSDILDSVGQPSPCAVLIGGEPTLRKDLLKLISGLVEKGFTSVILHTDGVALHNKGVLSRLMTSGLTGLVYRLSSLRVDANDWLLGYAGGTKAMLKSMRTARELGLSFSAEVVLTRPTLPLIKETVEGLCRLGVNGIRIRRLRAKAAADALFVSLSPRISQIDIPLREAETAAYRNRIPFEISGFPCSLLPQLTDSLVADERYDVGEKCPSGDCKEACQGMPMDYGSRFGWHEFNLEPEVKGSTVIRRVHFHLQESSRRIRKRLVSLTEDSVSTLRITGDFRHHAAPLLLKDALRLSIPQLEISGDLQPFLNFSHSQMIAMKQFHRVDACVYGLSATVHDQYVSQPGAFEKQMEALSRFDIPNKGIVLCLPNVETLRSAMASTPDYDPELSLSFRLVPPGGSLSELRLLAQQLPERFAQKIQSLLPSCLRPVPTTGELLSLLDVNWKHAAPHERGPLPGDRLTFFDPCPYCNESACPGLAKGWNGADLMDRPFT